MEILSIKKTNDPTMLHVWLKCDTGERVTQAYRESDPHGHNPHIKQFLLDNPDFPIGDYVAPPARTPEELRAEMPLLTARQFRLGLVAAGLSPSRVTAAIEEMPVGPDRNKAQIEWEYATIFNRTHPLTATVGAALGLSDAQIDTMWTAAASF